MQIGQLSHNYGLTVKLVGGCDIIMEMFQQGELQTLVKEAAEQTNVSAEDSSADA